jgi:hypothetical protein
VNSDSQFFSKANRRGKEHARNGCNFDHCTGRLGRLRKLLKIKNRIWRRERDSNPIT